MTKPKATESKEEEKKKNKIDSKFHPDTITLETFHSILSQYDATVVKVHRGKALRKLLRKTTTKKKPQRKAKTAADEEKEEERENVESEVEAFMRLDGWRYDELPELMKGRVEGGEGLFLDKEEAVKLMEWKLKHGVFRPALLGMVKSNPAPTVRKSTSAAFAILAAAKSASSETSSESDSCPTAALETLTKPLRGVGVATASLLLSVSPPKDIGSSQVQPPFYSDDTYIWLCGGLYPGLEEDKQDVVKKMVKHNGELNVKYNMNEYRKLWDAVKELRERLGEGEVSSSDIEKVAFVLRLGDVGGSPEGAEEGKKRKLSDDGEKSEKVKKRG